MSDGTLSQSDIDAMLRKAAASGADAVGPRPRRDGRASIPALVVQSATIPPTREAEPPPPIAPSPREGDREEDHGMRAAIGARNVSEDANNARATDAAQSALVREVSARIDLIERSLLAVSGDGAAARRAEEQVRALQQQIRSLTGHVASLRRRVDDLDRRLAQIQRRPHRRNRRTLWSASLYVDAAAGGAWRPRLRP